MKSPHFALFLPGAVAALGLLFSCSNVVAADVASPSAVFPFVIPWNDGSKTPLDVSFLNDAPAGKNGRLVARGEHFVEEKTGRRVRLLGVVWTFASNFPTRSEAEAVAARLAKYGVNAVRLHYFDQPGPSRASIWKSPGVLDAAQLDRMDYLLAQFKKRGIYVNVNLKVAREFASEEGLPSSVADITLWSDKRVDYFDRRMIELQKLYARQLLTRRNPHTGLSLASDPGVYAVEINNENSLSEADDGAELLRLPAPFRAALQERWNLWLARKYASTRALEAAWQGASEMGPELVVGEWNFERHDPVQARHETSQGITQVWVDSPDGVGWHAQLGRAGLDLKDGQTYTLSFRARSDRAQSAVPLGVSRDQDDWRNVGLGTSISLTTQWQPYSFVFTARETVPGHSRIAIELGALAGRFEIADLSLRAGASAATLSAGQNLEARSVPLPEARYGALLGDWRLFLLETEQSYVQEMRGFLKNDLRVGAMVINSQINYGRLNGPYRENAGDYVDIHAYHDHPQTPLAGWDPVGALFFNAPMTPLVGLADKSTFGPFLMRHRLAGKPFSVSEYNHPAPNEYGVETLPLLATLGARQDFDALLLHEYGDYGSGADTSKIQAYFAVGSDPGKWAFLPSMALLYRRGLIQPATSTLRASLPAHFSPQNANGVDGAWKGIDLNGAALNAQTRLHLGAAPRGTQTQNAPQASKTRLQVTSPNTPRAIFSASAPGALVVTGAVANRTVSLGGASFSFGASPNNFAALTCVSYDGLPLAQSKKSLLTVMARAQNTGQTWRADRRKLLSWGNGPVQVETVAVTISLPATGPRRVFALDETGQIKAPVKADFKAGKLRFSVSPSQRSVWYLIAP